MRDATLDKKKYIQKNKNNSVQVGVGGFLISFDQNKRRECLSEVFNLLSEFVDPEEITEDDPNVEKRLDAELKLLQKHVEKPILKKREVNCRGLYFLEWDANDIHTNKSATVVSSILSDLTNNKTRRTKYLRRLVPVQITCKAELENILRTCNDIFPGFFKVPDAVSFKFSIVYSQRNNSSIKRDDVIKSIASIVPTEDNKHTVDLKNPDLVILIEIIQKRCFISVVKDYYKHKKFNVQLLSQ